MLTIIEKSCLECMVLAVRYLASQHLNAGYTERPYISQICDGLAKKQLRRHVIGRADKLLCDLLGGKIQLGHGLGYFRGSVEQE